MKKIILVIVVLSTFISCKTKIKTNVPSLIRPLETAIEMHCAPLVSSSMDSDEGFEEPKIVEARVKISGDEFSVSIDGDKLNFITVTAVKSGVAEPAVFQIISNDESHLIAVMYRNVLGSQINTFTLNKKNGLGVWSKVNTSFLDPKSAPSAYATYVSCR